MPWQDSRALCRGAAATGTGAVYGHLPRPGNRCRPRCRVADAGAAHHHTRLRGAAARPSLCRFRGDQTVSELIVWLDQLRLSDLPRVGGKNASLGEMIGQLGAMGVQVPGGFATTSLAFQQFLADAGSA